MKCLLLKRAICAVHRRHSFFTSGSALILLLAITLISLPHAGLAGVLYTPQELEKLGDLWIESKMIFDAELSQHVSRVKEIQALKLNDAQKAVLLKREFARHDTLSEAFAETRGMVQSALIDESNARLSPNSNSERIRATAGKQAGDAGYRMGESDLDAGGGERAVNTLKEVAGEMGLDNLVGSRPVVDLNKYDSAGVLELRDGFELTINKTGLAAKPGSEFHGITTAIDARHPETFLSQKLLFKNQAGAAYIEVQDHLKKASKGQHLSGAEMISTPGNMEKARIMCKSTRKVMDLNLVDDATLTRILQQNGLEITPSQFRDQMFKIEGSTRGRLTAELNDADFLDKVRNTSRDIFSASENTSFKTAKQELADLRSKAAQQPPGSGLRQVYEDEILDSVAKMKEGRAANREFRSRSAASDTSTEWSQLADPKKRPALAEKKLDSAFEQVPKNGSAPEVPETSARIFKAYNDLNDAAQMAKIVEDYMEGRASLAKTLIYTTASVADITVTQGAAGAVVQTGEKIYDLSDAKASRQYAKQRNMELYLNQFAMEFRKGGMSKKDAIALVEEAVGKNDLSLLKKKIQQLREDGQPVREPHLIREKDIQADDTMLERADQVLAGGGGQKIADRWDAYDNIDEANRRNLELYLTEWEVTLRKGGVAPEEAKKLVGQSMLAGDFSSLQQRALELKAQGKDISLPVLRHDTIEPDDTVWERVQNYELTKHTILAPSRVVDAWAQGELSEADLEMRAITQKADTKTAMFGKLLKAGIDSKRALTALNNWDDGESGLLEMVLKEARENIRKKRLDDQTLIEARDAEARALEKLQRDRQEIRKVLGWIHDLANIAYQVESDPYPILFTKDQKRAKASLVVTSNHDPEMFLSSIKASLQSVFGVSPDTRVSYEFLLPGHKGAEDGIWEVELPAQEAVHPLDVLVTTTLESTDPILGPVNRQLTAKLAVDLQVVEAPADHNQDKLQPEKTEHAAEASQQAADKDQYAWFLIDIVDYDPVEAREKYNSDDKPPYRRDASYGRGSYYKKDTYTGRTDTYPDPDMINGEYAAIQATWSAPPLVMHANEKVTLNVTIACAGKELSYFSFGGSTGAIFDHENIRPGYARYNIKFTDKDGKSHFAVDSRNDYATISREVSAIAPSVGEVENGRLALLIGFPTQVGSLGTKYVYEWQKVGTDKPRFTAKDLVYPHPPVAASTQVDAPASTTAPQKGETSKPVPTTTTEPKREIAATPPVSQTVLPHPPEISSSKQPAATHRSDSSLVLEKNAFLPGEAITVHFTASKDFPPKAWVGMYPAEVPHIYEQVTKHKYLAYLYLNGMDKGTLSFTAPPQPGNYDFRMHDRDSGAKDVEVASISFIVHNPSTLTVPKNTFTEGEEIKVSFSVAKADDKDWVGIFAKDAEPKKYISYQYTKGKTKGELTFPAKTTGEFRFGFYGKDKWEKLAPDVYITVVEGVRSLRVKRDSFRSGESIEVSFATPLPNAKDWVGIYRKGAEDKKYISYQYTKGLANGTLTFDAPRESGEFEFRFFEKDGWKKIATSRGITVSK